MMLINMAALMCSIIRTRIPKCKFRKISLFDKNSSGLKIETVCGCYYSTVVDPENKSEFSETPEYPPCFDPSPLNLKRMVRQQWYDHIKNLPTVEQKLVEFGKNRQIYKVFLLSGISKTYNPLPFTLFTTRTHLIRGMPNCYNNINVDKLVDYITPQVLQAIREVFASDFAQNPTNSNMNTKLLDKCRGQMLTDVILRLVTSLLSHEMPHLRNCQVSGPSNAQLYHCVRPLGNHFLP